MTCSCEDPRRFDEVSLARCQEVGRETNGQFAGLRNLHVPMVGSYLTEFLVSCRH